MTSATHIGFGTAISQGIWTSADVQYFVFIVMLLVGCTLLLIVYMSMKNRERISSLSETVGELRKSLGLLATVTENLRATTQDLANAPAEQFLSVPAPAISEEPNEHSNENAEEQLAFLREELIWMREQMGPEREQAQNQRLA